MRKINKVNIETCNSSLSLCVIEQMITKAILKSDSIYATTSIQDNSDLLSTKTLLHSGDMDSTIRYILGTYRSIGTEMTLAKAINLSLFYKIVKVNGKTLTTYIRQANTVLYSNSQEIETILNMPINLLRTEDIVFICNKICDENNLTVGMFDCIFRHVNNAFELLISFGFLDKNICIKAKMQNYIFVDTIDRGPYKERVPGQKNNTTDILPVDTVINIYSTLPWGFQKPLTYYSIIKLLNYKSSISCCFFFTIKELVNKFLLHNLVVIYIFSIYPFPCFYIPFKTFIESYIFVCFYRIFEYFHYFFIHIIYRNFFIIIKSI